MSKVISLVVMVINLSVLCAVRPNGLQAQSVQTCEQLRQQFDSTDDRELVYSKLMQQGEPGYRVICDLFAAGKIDLHDWTNWEYDHATRMDTPNAGGDFDNFVYRASAKEKEFLDKMANGFAKSSLPDGVCDEMMRDERLGARLLGYAVIRVRYHDAPDFKPSEPPAERAKQLAILKSFLATKQK